MSLDSLGVRVLEGLTHYMSLVVAQARIRFQISAGAGAGLGIAGVAYEVVSGGTVVATGTTDANGEVIVPIPLIQTGACVLRIFGSEFPITALGSWEAVTTTIGKQQRLDHLGYVTGYQLSNTIDPPSDGTLTERHHHSINDFQWEEDIAVDGHAGATTQTHLTTAAGL